MRTEGAGRGGRAVTREQWSRPASEARVLTLLLLLGAIVVTVLWMHRAHERARQSLAPVEGSMRAYLLVRPADCRSHMELLRLLERERIAPRLERGGILLLGSAAEAGPVTAWAAHEFPAVAVRRLTMLQRHHLSAIGWDGRPALLVVGARGAPRLLLPVPMTIPQRIALGQGLEALARYETENP